MLSRRLIASSAAGALAIALAISACTTVKPSSSSSPSTTSSVSGTAPSGLGSGSGGSNARSGPAEGGASGTVGSVFTPTFTVSTATGQTVTVNEASTTTYQEGTSSISAGAITTGAQVLVLGTTSGTTITATQVVVQPAGSGGSAASWPPGWSHSSKGHRPHQSRPVRSHRTTVRGQGRSSAEPRRIGRLKLR